MNLDRIKTQVDAVEGWLNDAEGRLLYRLARNASNAGVIVEIGSWKGKSTIWLGHGSHDGPNVNVHAIDPHTGSPEHHQNSRLVWTFDQFQQNIKTAGVDDVIVPHVDFSTKVAQSFTKPVSLVFIDGQHDYESAKQDYESWYPKVVEGGVMAFHDTTGWDGPRKVVVDHLFKSHHFKNVRFVRSITYGEKTAQNTAIDRMENRINLAIFLTYALIYRVLWRLKRDLRKKIPSLLRLKPA
ncbi:MAG: class I SAM-dependent methyltransferase [Verrucomicrobiota bacterium]